MTQPCSTPAARTRRVACPIAAELETFAPLVEQMTFYFLRRVPRNVSIDDIRSAAMCGLLDALRRGGVERGPAFYAYVRTRIRGAIIDELRKFDWLSRSARREENDKRDTDAVRTTVIAIDDVRADRVEQLCDATAVTADRLVEARLDCDAVRRAVLALPARERLVVSLYYLEDVSLTEIAQQLGVTLSRVSQLRARAVEMLRTLIEVDERTEEVRAEEPSIICKRAA
jgi:RNA polymerase sigma factor for flagellar operon FliA